MLKKAERIQKIIAQVGLCSRREAEEWIRQGEITLNGKPAKLGDRAIAGKDAIKIRGKLLQATPATKTYVLFNKPRAVISMMSVDPLHRETLKDFFSKSKIALFPVGRLDFHTEGLLILTNDGDFSERFLKHPQIVRTYVIKVSSHPSQQSIAKLEKGTRLEGKLTKPYKVKVVQRLSQKSKIEIVFVGRGLIDMQTLFERAGLKIEKITLVALGHIALKGLPPGATRTLSQKQAYALVDQPELGLKRVDTEAPKKEPQKIPTKSA